MTGDEKLVSGPAGHPVRLQHSIPQGYDRTVLTDENGIASFEDVPNTNLHAYFIQDKENGKEMYSMDIDKIQALFTGKNGFELENAPNGFVIWTTLVEGYIK